MLAPDGGQLNLARTRAETYARPGALPDVTPASIDEDLARRDFTVNAIAVGLSPDVRGEVRAAEHALSDVEDRLLRVLHDRSFLDDPTRLLRLSRYETRLGFAIEGRTAGLAGKATLRTVSGDRIGNEVRLALAEPEPVEALAAAAGFGDPVPRPDPELARAGLALLPADGRPDLLILGTAGPDGLAERLRSASPPPTSRGRWRRPTRAGWPLRSTAARGPRRSRPRPADGRPRPSRSPARWAPKPRRARGWTICATSAWRSPDATCSTPASPRGPTSAAGSSGRSSAAWTASSRPAARPSLPRRSSRRSAGAAMHGAHR